MNNGKGRFSQIIQLANQETQDAALEAPPEPTTPEPEPMPTIVTPTSPKAKASASKSKSPTYREASFYIPKKLSIELDQFVSLHNLEAAERGLPTVDRSDLAETLLIKLIELGGSKGQIKALEFFAKLKT